MDLNVPVGLTRQLRSSFTIRLIVEKKIAHREFFISKYGEESYALIVGSELPFVITGLPVNGVLGVYVYV